MTDKKRTRTAGGKPVTDEQIQHLADEAEAGYDTATLRRTGGRKPLGFAAARVIPVRIDLELETALKARVEADHANTSEVIATPSAPGSAPPEGDWPKGTGGSDSRPT